VPNHRPAEVGRREPYLAIRRPKCWSSCRNRVNWLWLIKCCSVAVLRREGDPSSFACTAQTRGQSSPSQTMMSLVTFSRKWSRTDSVFESVAPAKPRIVCCSAYIGLGCSRRTFCSDRFNVARSSSFGKNRGPRQTLML
jgi:hypothetical protein